MRTLSDDLSAALFTGGIFTLLNGLWPLHYPVIEGCVMIVVAVGVRACAYAKFKL